MEFYWGHGSAIFTLIASVFGYFVGGYLARYAIQFPEKMFEEWRCQCRELLNINDDNSGKPEGGKHEDAKVSLWSRPVFVQVTLSLLLGLSAWHFGAIISFACVTVFVLLLVMLSFIDMEHKLLPDDFTLLLLWCGIFVSLFGVFVDVRDSVIGAIVGYLSLWSMYHLFKLATGKEGMGYGDFKLLAAIGAWVGWQSVLLVIVMSAVVGVVGATVSMVANKASTDQVVIPYGPYLSTAGFVSMLWGDSIVMTYLSFVSG